MQPLSCKRKTVLVSFHGPRQSTRHRARKRFGANYVREIKPERETHGEL